jgi:hypothetical protein
LKICVLIFFEQLPIKKSDFWEKSDFSNSAQGAHQEIRFLGKIGFLKQCPRCPSRNPIFGKNRISQNRAQGAHQEIRFFGKNRISQTVPKAPIKKSDFWEKSDFSKPCPRCHRSPIFGKNRISQTVPKVPIKKSDFWEKYLGKIGFLLKWSGLEISAFVY